MQDIRTDWYYHIGEQHLRSGAPCQDYALAGTQDDMAYAIVSDGCSSGGRTDVGARIVALAAQRALGEESWRGYATVDALHADAARLRQEFYMDTGRTLFGLEPHDMLATCIVALSTPRGGYVRVYGDGIVALVFADGAVRVHEYEWLNNMPFYLAYGSALVGEFVSAHGGALDAACCAERIYTSGDSMPAVVEHTLAAGLRGMHIALGPEELSTLACIALYSDGVGCVSGVPVQDVVREMLAFKTLAPGFVKRRVKRALTDYARGGHAPMDDVACAALLRMPQEEE